MMDRSLFTAPDKTSPRCLVIGTVSMRMRARRPLDWRGKRFSNRKGNENVKTKLCGVALVASAVTIAQANPGGVHVVTGASHKGAVARSAPAVHAPMRPGGVSSFRSTPMRSHGSRPFYSGPRPSSFGMRSSPSSAYRRPFYSSRGSFTRSGPYTVATIPQRNRVATFANRRNPSVARVWNQRNTGTQFRNGNNLRNPNNLRNRDNHLRRDWQKHVFAHGSGGWHRDWNRNCDHWWNGHQCSFINGSWVIFNLGFSPWGLRTTRTITTTTTAFRMMATARRPTVTIIRIRTIMIPATTTPAITKGRCITIKTAIPTNRRAITTPVFTKLKLYDDPNGYSNESQSDYSTIAAAQERLGRQGYYRGETDGVLSPEMQKAVRRYQSTNGLRQTGYLDGDTLAIMGLSKGTSY